METTNINMPLFTIVCHDLTRKKDKSYDEVVEAAKNDPNFDFATSHVTDEFGSHWMVNGLTTEDDNMIEESGLYLYFHDHATDEYSNFKKLD